ncbi:hypothetical protein PtA15_18A439 [Puccinia triticina]|uniref:Secreted protein n=2 Tax=Puccinia triticina TaxID=208348 RepID=A0ABY7D8H7_9BASI|nr:uncharacterized protein PtA15_18A439 [Puccinia triticina]WAQ93378.1 hypothetical protein PtA15_18A439 [Puccinia triticina]
MKFTIISTVVALTMATSVQSKALKPDISAYACLNANDRTKGMCILKGGDKKNPTYFLNDAPITPDGKKFSCVGVKINNVPATDFGCCQRRTAPTNPGSTAAGGSTTANNKGLSDQEYRKVCTGPDTSYPSNEKGRWGH